MGAPVYLLTGASAAGKSTVGQLLAERFDRGVHVRGDVFRRMVVAGRHEMSARPSEEALAQLGLRYRLGAATADAYAAAGFTTVWQDVILGHHLPACVDLLGARPVHVVVLAPSVDALRRREAARAKTGYGGAGVTPDLLDRALREETPRLGLWLDTSDQTPAETVDAILA
jgi:chloramphenicol 3-O-phosphotransferase